MLWARLTQVNAGSGCIFLDPNCLCAQYSGGSPYGALCGRGDLDPDHPRLSGCYDTKVTSFSMATRREAFAVNGPTREVRRRTQVASRCYGQMLWLEHQLCTVGRLYHPLSFVGNDSAAL